MKKLYIAAIETSCDDTSVAISCNEKILSNVTLTSSLQHRKYGGIVPEVAARGHEASIYECFTKALKQAKIQVTDITHIAYTAFPGLPGSLHVGKVFAKSMASLLNVPLLPIDHMMGHVFSFSIGDTDNITYPFISLIVSGGHTTIYLHKSIKCIRTLNQTSDDSVGEMLDKIGRMLGLPYPGGISIDKIYNSRESNLKMIHHFPAEQPFSFSGIKTHILNLLNRNKMAKIKTDKTLIASSLLRWTVDEILIKINHYSKLYNIKRIVVGGGVSANRLLRSELLKLSPKVLLPIKKYTNDNAAMIANYAYICLK